MEILVVIIVVCWALAMIDFLFYLVNKERCLGNVILRVAEFFTIIVGPLLFLSALLFVFEQQLDSAIKAFADTYDGYGLFHALLLPMRE